MIDKSGVNLAGLQNMNLLFLLLGIWRFTDIILAKYLNNVIEQNQRLIKEIVRPMMGFKSFRSASTILGEIEVTHMVRKKQFGPNGQSPFKQFVSLAG